MVLDFYTETFGPFVYNVTNTIYFQAWATEDRADVFEFQNASLRAELPDKSKVTVINSAIRTEHRGKGAFSFHLNESYQRIFLEFTTKPSEQLVQRDVFLNQFHYLYTADPAQTKPVIYNQNNEVTFSVLNPNKVVAAYGEKQAGTVTLRFQTNELVDPADKYLAQIKYKEEVLGQTVVRLNKTKRNHTVEVRANRTMVNGGLMTVNLYKVS